MPSLWTAVLTNAGVKAEAATLAVFLLLRFVSTCIFRLLCKKVGDLLGNIHECTVVNTAGLLHSLSLSKFLFQTFSSGFRSLSIN